MQRKECKRGWWGKADSPCRARRSRRRNHPAGLRDSGAAGRQAGGGWRAPGSAQAACCLLCSSTGFARIKMPFLYPDRK